MSNFLFTDTINGKTIPSVPGAYVFRGAYSSSTNSMIPIYNSIQSFPTSVGILNDTDSAVIVLPGFSLLLYDALNDSYGSAAYDNIYGTEAIFRVATNKASGCRLYCKNNSSGITYEVTTSTITPIYYSISAPLSTPYPTGSTVVVSNATTKTYSFVIYQTNNTIYNIPRFNSSTMEYIYIWIIGGGGGGGATSGLGGNMYQSSNGGHSGKCCVLVNPLVDIAISNCTIGMTGTAGVPRTAYVGGWTDGFPGGYTSCIINSNWITVDGGRGGGKADGLSTSTSDWPRYLDVNVPSVVADQTLPIVNNSIRNLFSQTIAYGSNAGVYTNGGHTGVDRESGGNGGDGWTSETISGANTALYTNVVSTATNGVGGNNYDASRRQRSLAGSGAGAGGGGSFAGENGSGYYGGTGAQGLITVIIKYKV